MSALVKATVVGRNHFVLAVPMDVLVGDVVGFNTPGQHRAVSDGIPMLVSTMVSSVPSFQ